MPCTPAGLIKDPLCLLSQHLLLCKQHNRIEIAHHCDLVTHALPAFVQSHAPVESNHIATSLAHQLQQRCCPRAEVDHRNAWGNTSDDAACMRQHKLAVVVRTQTTHPRIKQLHCLRSCCNLRVQIFRQRSRD